MKKSEIHFNIELDKQNVPEKILWNATDNPSGKEEETKAITMALWDSKTRNTMKIDLWTKDMPVDEMKLFYLETIGGMSESLRSSTSDDFISDKLDAVCKELMEYVEKQYKQQ